PSTSVVVDQDPALSIVKDGTIPGGSANVVGEVVSWTINVSIGGDDACDTVTVTDALSPNVATDLVGAFNSGDTDQDGRLDVGETWPYPASHTVTRADLDSNGGGGGDLDSVPLAFPTRRSSDLPSTSVVVDQDPALSIVKDGTVPGGSANVVGEVVSWTINV